MRKAIMLTARLCDKHKIIGWRQSQYHINQVRRLCRSAQNSKRGGNRDEETKIKRRNETPQNYIALCEQLLKRVTDSNISLSKVCDSLIDCSLLSAIAQYITDAERQIDQTNRRVIQGEVIPHGEKVFSIFERHTEWVCKGKAGTPVELGVRVCISESHAQFILHHEIMSKLTDERLTLLMAKETKVRFPKTKSISYDRGFYSGQNRDALNEVIDEVSLPKKGKRSEKDNVIELSDAFQAAKKKHSAVESAINALGVHGLDMCPEHGLKGFKRYVALAIVARNVQRIGAILVSQEKRLLDLRRKRMLKKLA